MARWAKSGEAAPEAGRWLAVRRLFACMERGTPGGLALRSAWGSGQRAGLDVDALVIAWCEEREVDWQHPQGAGIAALTDSDLAELAAHLEALAGEASGPPDNVAMFHRRDGPAGAPGG